jgi:magnesium chelatase family protein
VAISIASRQIPKTLADRAEFYGELSLDGRILATSGLLAAGASQRGPSVTLITPSENAPAIAALCDNVVGLATLGDLRTPNTWKRSVPNDDKSKSNGRTVNRIPLPAGQPGLWRACEIAATGGHHMLMSGEPGAGKTMAATLIKQLLPELPHREALETQIIFDVANQASPEGRVFRSPHHSISVAGLVGGTRQATPGEISLAHHGVLFLDELPEFSLASIEALRQPLEAGEIRISRSEHSHSYPAKFQLIAAMNPCPCGYRDSPTTPCRCSLSALSRYNQKLSGPLLDRIDLFISVNRSKLSDVMSPQDQLHDDLKRTQYRVAKARELAMRRQGVENSRIAGGELMVLCALSTTTKQWLEKTGERLQLSGRGLHRCLRVARTIADLSGQQEVTQSQLTEALVYRAHLGQTGT